jgi:hypothetical protein
MSFSATIVIMRYIAILTTLAALALAGCGTTTHTTTFYHPPNLGTPGADAHDTGNGNRTLRTYKPKQGNAEQANFYNASGCGVERWAIKTLTDPGANQVNLTPQESSIADLVAIAPPVSPTDRVGPTETTTFRITGTLIFVAKEADGDYHLAIEDAKANTMIAEIPNPSCASGSVVLNQITEARKAFEAKFGVPGQYPNPPSKPNVPVTLTGVGFFDKLHGQTGVAPNGIELHPVLSISFTGSGVKATAPVPKLHLVIGEVYGAD